MEVIYQLAPDQIKQLHVLYQEEWWSKGRTLEETEKCVAGSQICIGILNGDQRLIGFARVLTDYIFKAIIFDVIVETSYRKQGIGHRLIELVKNHRQLTEVKHFELYGLPDMQRFYAQYGFTTEVGGVVLMRKDQT